MMNEVSKPTPQMSFFRRWANEIVSGVVVTIIVAGLAAVWPTLLAWAFPDYVSGNYLLLGPEEKPSHGPDVINVQLSSYNGHVWGSMAPITETVEHRWVLE